MDLSRPFAVSAQKISSITALLRICYKGGSPYGVLFVES
jgi:hypothetical protein